VFKTVLKNLFLINCFISLLFSSLFKHEKESRAEREDSGVEWFASNTFCQEREQSIILPKPHTVYNLSSMCVCFVRYLVVVVVVVVVREEKKYGERGGTFFLCAKFIGNTDFPFSTKVVLYLLKIWKIVSTIS
jgi:hypothetical protein